MFVLRKNTENPSFTQKMLPIEPHLLNIGSRRRIFVGLDPSFELAPFVIVSRLEQRDL